MKSSFMRVVLTLLVLVLFGSVVVACCPTGVQAVYQQQVYQQQAACYQQPVAQAVAYAYPVALMYVPTTTVQVQAPPQVPAAPQPQFTPPAPVAQIAPPQQEVVQQQYTPAPVVVRQVQQYYAMPQVGFAASYGYAGHGVASVQRNVIVQRNVVGHAPARVIVRQNVQRQRQGILGRLFANRVRAIQAPRVSRTTVIVR